MRPGMRGERSSVDYYISQRRRCPPFRPGWVSAFHVHHALADHVTQRAQSCNANEKKTTMIRGHELITRSGMYDLRAKKDGSFRPVSTLWGHT